MKIVRRILYWVVALTLVFVTFWFGFTRKSPQKQEEKKIVPVEVEDVNTGSIEETIELTGWIRANQVVDVASKVAGRIESLRVTSGQGNSSPVEEGVIIGKGQQIGTIDHDVYVAQEDAAKAAVKSREVELADAQREKKRIIALYEGGSATEQSKDKAVTAAELAAAGLNAAKANLELAQISLRESTIISPIDGVVTVKHIDEGNLIRVGDRLVTIADIRTVKIVVAVSEKYGGGVTVGMPVKIGVDTLPDSQFEAKVYSVYPALDAQTHAIQIEIRLDNSGMLLKPGMFARVTLVTQAKKDVVVVPRDIVLGGKIDEPYVYVVDSGVAHKRIVKLGITQADRCEITDGLKSGESLVVNGMHFLKDGVAVEVVRLEDIK
jgi:membrane fusion protein (multidrug efflux system)